MPYKSARQRRYMHAKHPKIAKKWDEKYGGKVRTTKSGKKKSSRPKKLVTRRRGRR